MKDKNKDLWAGPDKVGDHATAGRRHRPNFVGTDVSKNKKKKPTEREREKKKTE